MTPLERKLLIMMEECAELSHVCSKIIRFGNTDRGLLEELADVAAMSDLIREELNINELEFRLAKDRKFYNLSRYEKF